MSDCRLQPQNESKPSSPTVRHNKGEGNEDMKPTQLDRKNTSKRDSYALAFGMISTALHHNFPLQAIAVEESIISDRLWSALNASKPNGGKKETLGRALDDWKRLSENGVPSPLGKEAESMRYSLVRWWDSRNRVIHGIVKSFRGESPNICADNFERIAMKWASIGAELARQVCNWSSKQIRKNGKAV